MERMSLFWPLQFKTTSVRLDSNFFFLNWSQNDYCSMLTMDIPVTCVRKLHKILALCLYLIVM